MPMVIRGSRKIKGAKPRSKGQHKALNKIVKGLIDRRIEHYNYDASAQSTNLDTNSVVVHLSAIAQGDGVGQRAGLQVRAKRLEVRIGVRAAEAVVCEYIRVMIVQFKHCAGTALALADVLPLTSGNARFAGCEIPLDGTQLDNDKKDFKILWDRRGYLQQTTDDTARGCRFFRFSKKLDFPIAWTGSLATDESSNQLYLLAYSTSVNAGHVLIDYHTRLVYTDA